MRIEWVLSLRAKLYPKHSHHVSKTPCIILSMVDLARTLQGNDLVFLRMVANAWGIDCSAPDAYSAIPPLVSAILDQSLIHEIVEALPTEAKSAIQDLIEHQGKLLWSVFTRRYGEVRVIGAGRQDRERPDLSPVSPAEVLWYRAIIGKAFFNIAPEAQEYAYIPEDLLEHLEPWSSPRKKSMGRPASPRSRRM